MNMVQDDKKAPMASAPLQYDANGMVACDEMWDTFCDLAVEGGPPHRNEMLLKAKATDITSQGFKTAMNEIIRAYDKLIPYKHIDTGDGWIRIELYSRNMASWFWLNINMENVSCQRKGKYICIPVNDNYTLEKEVKNCITVVAKSYHYWSKHRDFLSKIIIHITGIDLALLMYSGEIEKRKKFFADQNV